MVEYAKLDAESVASLVDSFGDLFVELASGVTKILPQRYDSNIGIHDTPLPCLPFSFCKMREDKFVALVVRMRSRLESNFTAKDIDALESEHQEFRGGIRGEVMRPVNAGSFFGLSIDNIVSLVKAKVCSVWWSMQS